MTDWRSKLPKEDQELLDSLLVRIQKYKDIYEKSEDPQLIQMWLILLELAKSSGSKDNPNMKLVQKILRPKRTEIMDTIDNY